MSRCLFIDTSIAGASLALTGPSGSEGLLWSSIYPKKQGSSSGLAGRLGEGCEKTGTRVSDISQIVISRGPGSFTGIRAGLAFARGLAAASAIKPAWLGLSSLECAALALMQEETTKGRDKPACLWLFLPATRTHGFLAACQQGSCTSWLTDTQSMLAGKINLRQPPEGVKIIFASRWPGMEEQFNDTPKPGGPEAELHILRSALTGMISRAALEGPGGFSNREPEPRYLRKSTVEEKRDQVNAKERK